MRKSSRFAALALTAALALGVATPAFAADAPTVNKELQVNNGSSVTATFKYEAEFKASVPLTKNNAPEGLTSEATGPALSVADINLTATNAKADGTGALTFGDFSHAGYYVYTIKETPDTYSGTGEMQYDGTVYTLLVAHDNSGNNTYYIYKEDLSSGIDLTTAKESKIDFTNKYTETTTLEISKKVEGSLGDKTKKFKFTVTFSAADGMVLPKDKTAADVLSAITASDGVTWSNDHSVATFEIADSEKVTFNGIVAGVTYSISEDAVTNYTQSYAAVANGENSTSQSNLLIGEKTNTGEMTNKYEDITVTGLILDNAPFLILGATAVAGIVLYGAAKRKLTA